MTSPLMLPPPDRCRCGGASEVINVRAGSGQLRSGLLSRRRRCVVCGRRWSTWESMVHPLRLRGILEDRQIDPDAVLAAVVDAEDEDQS